MLIANPTMKVLTTINICWQGIELGEEESERQETRVWSAAIGWNQKLRRHDDVPTAEPV